MVRYADDLVLLTDKDARWTMDRLREMLGRLELELNEEKGRVVDAEKESFDFLGFTFKRVWNRVWLPGLRPRPKGCGICHPGPVATAPVSYSTILHEGYADLALGRLEQF